MALGLNFSEKLTQLEDHEYYVDNYLNDLNKKEQNYILAIIKCISNNKFINIENFYFYGNKIKNLKIAAMKKIMFFYKLIIEEYKRLYELSQSIIEKDMLKETAKIYVEKHKYIKLNHNEQLNFNYDIMYLEKIKRQLRIKNNKRKIIQQ